MTSKFEARPYPVPTPGDRSWRACRPSEGAEAFETRIRIQKELLAAAYAPWLTEGLPVRLLYDYGAQGLQRRADMSGCVGRIVRFPGPPFADYVHIRFEPVGRQRKARVLMVELEAIWPAADGMMRAAAAHELIRSGSDAPRRHA